MNYQEACNAEKDALTAYIKASVALEADGSMDNIRAVTITARAYQVAYDAARLALVREVIRRTNSGAAYLTSTLDSFAASVLAEIERGE